MMTHWKRLLLLVLTAIITFSLCVLAAMYTPPNFGHAICTISTEGGMARHPVYLGLNDNHYEVLVTGTVKPPYAGDVKIVLDGEPALAYHLYSQYPPDLGIHNFYGFNDNTMLHLSPGEKFMVALKISPESKIDKETAYRLRFYNPANGQTVLSLPIVFRELVNFSISKDVRRPYPASHGYGGKPDHSKKKDSCSVHSKKPHSPSADCCEE